jgi:hypothetical protein
MTIRTLIVATALSLPLSAPMLAAPADASSGSVSLNLQPRSADEARALRLGLGLYALHRDVRSNGHVTQRGVNNAAGIAQSGRGSQAIIHQEGCNHNGTVSQQGNNHAYGLFQFGCNGNHHASQRGHGQTGVTIQYSW